MSSCIFNDGKHAVKIYKLYIYIYIVQEIKIHENTKVLFWF